MNVLDLSGTWTCRIPGQTAQVTLPGTLDENGVGYPDTGSNQWHPDAGANDSLKDAGVIATRLTRRRTYEGEAEFTRRLRWITPEGKRIFLECGRSRRLSLFINRQSVPHFTPPSISTPQVFEVTGLLRGDDEITLVCDNSYPGWPRADIVYSSAATDETQTNWNGILGCIRLRIEEARFISSVRVYPHRDALDVCVEIAASGAEQAAITLTCDALRGPAEAGALCAEGTTEVWLRGLPLRADVRRWDEDEGHLYSMCVRMGHCEKTVFFGIRSLRAEDGRITLNGRPFFLRSEANCAVFPKTGYCPMTEDEWRSILALYRSYGVNCMRFHSHCPPEVAFTAADNMGMLMQPELSHWNPRDAFSSAESQAYYRDELTGILRMLANHPSFVMLTLGNELHMDEDGYDYAARLLDLARSIDPTRLYADGSNVHYGQRGCSRASDFYTADSWRHLPLRATSNGMRGWLNEQYPDLRTDYAAAAAAVRRESGQPVFSFEVGQYEVLPDFGHLDGYDGVTDPANIRHVFSRVGKAGLLSTWRKQVEASGELSLLCYRAEVEAALRTEGLSGISLLGLQDFPGQGTALVGMLDPLLESKPYPFARPERFRAFFTGVLPLALLGRFTYTEGETLTAEVKMANYGKEDLHGAARWSLTGGGLSLQGALPGNHAARGALTPLGTLRIPLQGVRCAARLTLSVEFCGHTNTYPVFVYPALSPACPENVYECRSLDDHALQILQQGRTVYLAPDASEDALPHSIKTQFSTDFWSVGTFPHQAGGMGQLIDASHPVFDGFPTEAHTDWQWWPMAVQRAVILPRQMKSIVAEMDSYAYLRPMAKLIECRCGGGLLMLSSMGLHNLLQYPEARALQGAIYAYLAGNPPLPQQEITPEEIRILVK